jgi:HK97 gp10 family phage protein
MERSILKTSVGKGGKVRIEITESGRQETDKLLANMPLELREKQLKGAIRAAAKVFIKKAKALAPPPGYVGDKPDKMSLRDSIAVKVKAYQTTVAGFVGPRRPYGNHAHLIEFGFDQHYVTLGTTGIKKKRKTPNAIPKKPFMRPAAISTLKDQEQAFVNHLRKGIGELA